MAEGPPRTFFWQVVWSVMAISNVVRWPLAIIVHIGGAVALFWDGLVVWGVIWVFILGPIAAVLVTLIVAVPFFVGGFILACLLVPARWLWTRERAVIPVGAANRSPTDTRTEAAIVEAWNRESREPASIPAGTTSTSTPAVNDLSLESSITRADDRRSTPSPDETLLHKAIVHASSEAVDSLLMSWTGLTGRQGMSAEESRVVRTEMIWYMLHMADRAAFRVGGAANRDKIITDTLIYSLVGSIVAAMLDGASPEDPDEWAESQFDHLVDGWNEAGYDYATCTEAVSSSADSALMGKSVDGRLAERVSNSLGIDGMRRIAFKTATRTAALSALNQLEVIALVSKISQS